MWFVSFLFEYFKMGQGDGSEVTDLQIQRLQQSHQSLLKSSDVNFLVAWLMCIFKNFSDLL